MRTRIRLVFFASSTLALAAGCGGGSTRFPDAAADSRDDHAGQVDASADVVDVRDAAPDGNGPDDARVVETTPTIDANLDAPPAVDAAVDRVRVPDASVDATDASADSAAVGDGGCVNLAAKASWEELPNPLALGQFPLLSVGPKDAWFGLTPPGMPATSARWDGSSFTLPDTTVPFGIRLWASGPDDVWFGGTPVRRWDGTSFKPAYADGSISIFGFGPQDVWLVGLPTASGQSLIHWNGSTFTPFAIAMPGLAVDALWGGATNDLWAFGRLGFSGSLSTNAWLGHWNGSSWTTTALSASLTKSRGFQAAWGSAATNIWATSEDYAQENPATSDGINQIWHYDGTAWTVSTEVRSRAPVQGVMSGSAADDIWMANGYDHHYDGTSWGSGTPGGVTWSSLAFISHASADEGWAAGHSGVTRRLLHFHRRCLDPNRDGGN